MSILRNLERQLMTRKTAAPDLSLTRLMHIARHEVEDKEEAKIIVRAAMEEVEAMQAKMAGVEAKEKDLATRLHKADLDAKALLKERSALEHAHAEMHGKEAEAEKKLKACEAMHQKIHAEHESTIKKQQAFIVDQQNTINALQKKLEDIETELREECRKQAKVEYLPAPVQAPASVFVPPKPPTVTFEVKRGGDGRISQIVAKPH